MNLIFRLAALFLVGLARLWADNQRPAGDRLIDLNVIALDSHGQPVTGLDSDDFQVTDAGKAQKIAFFRHNDSKLWQEPRRSLKEFSNRRSANIPHATVILFDLMNERFGTRGSAANQLVHDLETMESADYLYLYFLTLDGGLYAAHGLPESAASVESAGIPWTRQIKTLMDDSLRKVMRVRPAEIDVAVRVQLTYAALERLAVEVSRVPGRKNIVWITDGVPIELGPRRSDTGDFVDFTPLLQQLSEAMDQSGMAIYPVRQVMLGSPDSIGAGPGGGVGSLETLDEFAGLTGGRPDSGKDIGAVVRQAMNDMRTSYQIGYYAASKNWDSKFHKLRVTCRRKGVRLQAKTGYYAWFEPVGARARHALETVAASPFDTAEIGLWGSLEVDPGSPLSARIDAHIDANDVALAKDGDGYKCLLRLAAVTSTDDRPLSISEFISVDLHYSTEDANRVMKEGIAVSEKVAIGEGIKQVRLVVFDQGSNSVGSLTLPTIPRPQP